MSEARASKGPRVRAPRRPPSSGVLLVDKPGGWTSHDVVAKVRGIFGQREVGHTGTLDPLATGLLVLTLGRATRLGRFIEATEKVYRGTVCLGRSTTTFDAEGETVDEAPVPTLAPEQVAQAMASLTGTLDQPVPAFSAVKVGGERLYAKARRGEVVEAPVRRVTIHAFRAVGDEPLGQVPAALGLPDIGPLAAGLVSFEARVSKGTYIRTLAVQLGQALGVPAHLAALRRTRVGALGIEGARRIEELRGDPGELLSMAESVGHLAALHLEEDALAAVAHGRPLTAGQVRAGAADWEVGEALALLGPTGALVAVGTAELSARAARAAGDRERAVSYACVLAPSGSLG